MNSDVDYMLPDTPLTTKYNHQNWINPICEEWNVAGMKVLEVGSRVVTGANFRPYFSKANYTGFDYYAGNNVDVVGDAHKLSSYFNKGEKFDFIFSVAVFEHFAMPWLVAQEMGKLLRVGGGVFIETHFSYASHERPWHFFQFSDMALRVLFSPAMGFECVEAGFSNPIVGRFSTLASEYLQNQPIPGLFCHSEYYGRKVREVESFSWENAAMADLVGDSLYPKP